jgi:hypothetical protein
VCEKFQSQGTSAMAVSIIPCVSLRSSPLVVQRLQHRPRLCQAVPSTNPPNTDFADTAMVVHVHRFIVCPQYGDVML